jgi:hypothetical protein
MVREEHIKGEMFAVKKCRILTWVREPAKYGPHGF